MDSEIEKLLSVNLPIPPAKKKKGLKRLFFWKKEPVILPLSREQAEAESEKVDQPVVRGGSVREKLKREKIGFWDNRKLRKHPESSFFIEMIFSNGTSKEFVIISTEELFVYRKRWYYLRYEDSIFNITQANYKLLYHEDHAFPLSKEIIKKGETAFWSISPENIRPLIEMAYIKALVSNDFSKYLKAIAILCILILIFLFIDVYYGVKITKILKTAYSIK